MIVSRYVWSRVLAVLAAATLAHAGAEATQPERVLAGVLDVLAGDWNEDGEVDRAVLWRPSGEGPRVDLFVFLSGQVPQVLPGAAWSGDGWGSFPELRTAARGFAVISGNRAAGRERWEVVFDVAWREGRLWVVAYRYSRYGGSDADGGLLCLVEFASGWGEKNGVRFAVKPEPVPFEAWSEELLPTGCRRR